MAEPIANDWKAIHDRMQQIKAERSAFARPCPQRGGRGWISDFSDRRHSQAVGYAICGVCNNLMNLPPPRHVAAPPR
jgi:hypothetical protein